jgi:hypothetical protein
VKYDKLHPPKPYDLVAKKKNASEIIVSPRIFAYLHWTCSILMQQSGFAQEHGSPDRRGRAEFAGGTVSRQDPASI